MAKTISNRRYKYRRKTTLSPLHQLCGRWISKFESPPIRIFRTKRGYQISFEYRFDTTVTVAIKRISGTLEINLFGHIELAYDEISDRLWIGEEGMYLRSINDE